VYGGIKLMRVEITSYDRDGGRKYEMFT
jgi:hypothetical protein